MLFIRNPNEPRLKNQSLDEEMDQIRKVRGGDGWGRRRRTMEHGLRLMKMEGLVMIFHVFVDDVSCFFVFFMFLLIFHVNVFKKMIFDGYYWLLAG